MASVSALWRIEQVFRAHTSVPECQQWTAAAESRRRKSRWILDIGAELTRSSAFRKECMLNSVKKTPRSTVSRSPSVCSLETVAQRRQLCTEPR